MTTDEKYMQIAIDLSLNGHGKVSPNPLVGCVIVKENEIIGKGYHEKYGENHAEINAIKDAGLESLEDCDVYVTLEPCTHHGKTPPCSDELIKLKPNRVIIGMEDPNPIVSGNGIRALEGAGIKVESGILADKVKLINRSFIINITEKRPYVVAKFAQTLDGFISDENLRSKWISSEESRIIVHKYRNITDAILAGSGTVREDNPHLNTRLENGNNPKKVVFTSNINIPLDSNIFIENPENTIVVCTNNAMNIRKIQQVESTGVTVLTVSKDEGNRVDIDSALKKLYSEFDIGIIMLEAGSTLLSKFYKLNYIDELKVFIANKILGTGISPFQNVFRLSLEDKSRFKLLKVRSIGNDILAEYIRN